LAHCTSKEEHEKRLHAQVAIDILQRATTTNIGVRALDEEAMLAQGVRSKVRFGAKGTLVAVAL
jgi:hypothetical protein